jgi:hypothetical protein
LSLFAHEETFWLPQDVSKLLANIFVCVYDGKLLVLGSRALFSRFVRFPFISCNFLLGYSLHINTRGTLVLHVLNFDYYNLHVILVIKIILLETLFECNFDGITNMPYNPYLVGLIDG